MKTTHTLLLFALSASLLAQSRPPRDATGVPNNNYQSANLVNTHSQISATYCYKIQYKVDNVIKQQAVDGLPVKVINYPTTGSGYHPHDSGGLRAQVIFLPGAGYSVVNNTVSGVTAQPDGCLTWTYQFPGFAGWYTDEYTVGPYTYNWVDPQVGPLSFNIPLIVGGKNFYVHDTDPFNGQQFTPYIFSTQAISVTDGNHTYNGVLDVAKAFTKNAKYRIAAGASGYYNAARLTPGAVPDNVKILRGSLLDGGILDSDPGAPGVLWFARDYEQHADGIRVDILNPAQGGLPMLNYNLLVGNMQRAGCSVGTRDPNTIFGGGNILADPIGYWSTQNVVHFDCGDNPLLPPPPHGGR